MRRDVRVCLAMIGAALTAGRVSLAHDLVTTPDRSEIPSPPKMLSPSTAESEGHGMEGDERRAAALLLDLRTGFGLPLGEARTFATGRGAADVALGYRAESGRYAGVTAGVSQLDASLSGFHETTFQLGVDLAYRPTLRGRIEPWLGLGFAWQFLWLTKGDFYMKAIGPEFPIVRLGIDYRLTDQFAVGPFASFAYRRYDPFSQEGLTPIELSHVTRRDAWLVLGISASFRVSRL